MEPIIATVLIIGMVGGVGAGSQRRCEDVIQSRDKNIVSFTYRWTTGSGEHKNHHTRRVTMLLGGPKLPKLEVDADTVIA